MDFYFFIPLYPRLVLESGLLYFEHQNSKISRLETGVFGNLELVFDKNNYIRCNLSNDGKNGKNIVRCNIT
jgi:hypothetical protein